MKKFGFTLAEVLITLGIIGVVAALTAPALVTSGQNQANASRLAVTVSNLENAFTNAITQEGVENLCATKMWQGEISSTKDDDTVIGKFVGNLGQYIHLNGYKKEAMSAYYTEGPFQLSNDGAKGADADVSDEYGIPINLKNGAVAFVHMQRDSKSNEVKNKIIEKGGALYDRAGFIVIDVNGKSSPNIYGRDMFKFYLGTNGILYPVGGRDYALYISNGKNADDIWTNGDESTCCLDNQIKKGEGCTARVIEEGYKINY